MRSATLSGFGQGAGPVLSVRFEPSEFDPPQAVASTVSASTMNEERRRILAILGVSDTLPCYFAEKELSATPGQCPLTCGGGPKGTRTPDLLAASQMGLDGVQRNRVPHARHERNGGRIR